MPVKNRRIDEGQALRDRADQRAGKKVPFRGESQFVNYTLEKAERDHLKAQVWSEEDYDNMLTRICEQEYTVSISSDEYSGGFMCILRPRFTTSPNAGYLLSGRGSTPLRSFKQAAYIHGVVFEGDWASHYQARGKFEIDD